MRAILKKIVISLNKYKLHVSKSKSGSAVWMYLWRKPTIFRKCQWHFQFILSVLPDKVYSLSISLSLSISYRDRERRERESERERVYYTILYCNFWMQHCFVYSRYWRNRYNYFLLQVPPSGREWMCIFNKPICYFCSDQCENWLIFLSSKHAVVNVNRVVWPEAMPYKNLNNYYYFFINIV